MSLRILNISNTCTGCGACVSNCPKKALSLSYDEDGFYTPHIDEKLCIDCKACEGVCHVLNNEVPHSPSRNYTAYMVKANDRRIVKNSSSGGAFTLLANSILSNGGVVYGARYNYDKERLEHASTDDVPLSELQKSKYIESFMGNTFSDVREKLRTGRQVLFVGTPCQVEGLHTFLTKRKVDTSNLLLVRFVCHGVPSNKFFTEYKHYEEKKKGCSMTYFDFRPKTRGWRSSDWLMRFADGSKDKGPYYYYYYYYYFQLNTLLRCCCYNCHRVLHEVADITIADFWGIGTYRPENKDQEGISMMLVHSCKANTYIEAIRNACSIEEIPMSALDYIYREVNDREQYKEMRQSNIEEVRRIGYMPFVKKTLRNNIMISRLKGKLRNLLKAIYK